MNTIRIADTTHNITNESLAKDIFDQISEKLKENLVTINLDDVSAMTTSCAKAIFGKLYVDLGKDEFYKQIRIESASPSIQVVIEEGILSAIGQ